MAQAQTPVTPPSTNKNKGPHQSTLQNNPGDVNNNNNKNQNNDDDDDNNDDDNDIFTLPHQPTNIPTTFSPSKARAQARTTHQLTVLKSWLSSILLHQQEPSHPHHHPSSLNLITKWEQEYHHLQTSNPSLAADQLQTLQTLMFANQSGDERRRIIHAARVEELDRLRVRFFRQRGRGRVRDENENNVVGEIIDELIGGLDRVHTRNTSLSSLSSSMLSEKENKEKNSLDSLAESAVLLGVIPSIESSGLSLVEEFGRVVMERTVEAQRLDDHLTGSVQLQVDLERKVDAARKELDDRKQMKVEMDVEDEKMQAQTAQWTRETKQILMKIQEYQTRMASLERKRPGSQNERVVRVEDVLEVQERIKQRRDVVGQLEDRIKAFHGLPPDLEASRLEVKRAKAELDQLRRNREQLFEQIMNE